MQKFSSSPRTLISSLGQNRKLIKALVKREIASRYRGSLLGVVWSFITPLLMLAVYTFVFGTIFKSRWNSQSNSNAEFALILFAGLIVFNLFAECVNKAPGLILANVNYVKKVIFPLEILPWVALGSALFNALMSWCAWLLGYLLFFGLPHYTIIFLPLAMFPLMLLTVGLSWWLASLGVYLRDIAQLIAIAVNILMFLSPIFYPVTSLPERYGQLLILNPLTIIIEQVREVVFFGKYPNPTSLAISTMVGAAIAWLGFAWFQKTRRGFADVI